MIDKLHYISQQPSNGTHLTAIKAALSAGCKWIQLRVKDQPESTILEYALEAQTLCAKYGAKLIVNDHPEIALKAGAYGLHLGLQDMPIAEARQIPGSQIVIGGTANTFEHIEQRVAEGADYIGLGPYRFTKTKQKLSPILGLEGYREILEKVRSAGINIPIIAIGGIEPDDIAAIMQTGVHGVAVSGAITYAVDATQTTQYIYQQLNTTALKEA
ncbi:thiamine phosphate synthase [Mucilaginibacter lappiensis]|uniref:Thiamine-phosphate synthase n=1 Tax=Mucilaginibacter lappiensis TaxID=354630 RepID=A0A841J9L1_9SPHI|nr:thiamine phosphate synthase [Mucilaginibacter lappiensis]MBB6127859.1 thiamine-phosphate pyrophosphorylase [Mucilaginibacter lappiensis]